MKHEAAPMMTRAMMAMAGALSSVALSLMLACGQNAAPKAPPPPVEVGVVTVQPRAVLLTTVLPGRTTAFETSEVRPQVSGLIRARLFEEGQNVQKGQTLYQIDPRLYRASTAQASANLTSARALAEAARARAERYELLAREKVVSEQDYADAKANAQQADAAIEQARAALDTARINLRFTEVPAPIAGRIGRSLVTTGALVNAGQAEALATIQRLDPIYVDLQESSANLLALRRSLAQGGALPASADVRLELEDGSEYAEPGKLEFAEAAVDPSTGSVTLRARFPNPDGLLLPGARPEGQRDGAARRQRRQGRTTRARAGRQPKRYLAGRARPGRRRPPDRRRDGQGEAGADGQGRPLAGARGRAHRHASGRARWRSASRNRRGGARGALNGHALAHLRRSAHLRLGHLDRHHAGRCRCHLSIADRTVS
jgi:membrane fusion protein (multidrug efflux system)